MALDCQPGQEIPVVDIIDAINTNETNIIDHSNNTNNPHQVTVDQIGAAWETHGHQISEVENLWDRLTDRPTIGEHIDISTGVSDAGKPIKLDANGLIDSSMIPLDSGWVNQGQWTPTSGDEYPDTTGLPSGSYWSIIGVDSTNGYTFTTGDLNGEIIYNGNLMVYAGGSWYIKVSELNPFEFYKLDGSQAITANFAGGGFEITNISNGTQDNSAVTLNQMNTALEDKVNSYNTQTTVPRCNGIETLTQAEYDALTPDENTLYIIVG